MFKSVQNLPGYDIIVIAGQSNTRGIESDIQINPTNDRPDGSYPDLIYNQVNLTSKIYTLTSDFAPFDVPIPLIGNNIYSSPVPGNAIFGIEFAKYYAANNLAPGRKILIVHGGCPGTGFSYGNQYAFSSTRSFPFSGLTFRWDTSYLYNTSVQYGCSLYSELKRRMNSALSLNINALSTPTSNALTSFFVNYNTNYENVPVNNSENKIVAFLWHQGEGDINNPPYPSADQYSKYLEKLVDCLRDVQWPKVPFIVGNYSAYDGMTSAVPNSGYNTVTLNAYQAYNETFGSSTPPRWYTGHVFTADAPFVGGEGQPYDSFNSLHFSPTGQRLLGQRYYNAWNTALNHAPTTVPSVTNVMAQWVSGSLGISWNSLNNALVTTFAYSLDGINFEPLYTITDRCINCGPLNMCANAYSGSNKYAYLIAPRTSAITVRITEQNDYGSSIANIVTQYVRPPAPSYINDNLEWSLNMPTVPGTFSANVSYVNDTSTNTDYLEPPASLLTVRNIVLKTFNNLDTDTIDINGKYLNNISTRMFWCKQAHISAPGNTAISNLSNLLSGSNATYQASIGNDALYYMTDGSQSYLGASADAYINILGNFFNSDWTHVAIVHCPTDSDLISRSTITLDSLTVKVAIQAGANRCYLSYTCSTTVPGPDYIITNFNGNTGLTFRLLNVSGNTLFGELSAPFPTGLAVGQNISTKQMNISNSYYGVDSGYNTGFSPINTLVFINGVFNNQYPTTAPFINNDPLQLINADFPFYGFIDSPRIYSSAMSGVLINEIYQAELYV